VCWTWPNATWLQVDEWLLVQARVMTADKAQPNCIWKWLQLADQSGLKVSLAAMAECAVSVDRIGCLKEENIQELSTSSMRQLIAALVKAYPKMGSRTPFTVV
jgi:hypothetical protein